MKVRPRLLSLTLVGSMTAMLASVGAAQDATSVPRGMAPEETYGLDDYSNDSDCTACGDLSCGRRAKRAGCGRWVSGCGHLLREFLCDLKTELHQMCRWHRCGSFCRDDCGDSCCGGAGCSDGCESCDGRQVETGLAEAERRPAGRGWSGKSSTVELVPRPWPPEYQAPLPPRQQRANRLSQQPGPHRRLAYRRPQNDGQGARPRASTRANRQMRGASLRLSGPMPTDEEPAGLTAIVSDSGE